MAMNAREAQRMLDRSLECPALTAMIVPSPYGLTGDAYMRSLIAGGFLGTCARSTSTGFSSDLADPKTPLGWRQMTKYFGLQHAHPGHPLRDGPALGPAGEPRHGLRLEAHPDAPRPRDGQDRPGRHARQRAGVDHPGRWLVRRLPPERALLARDRHGHLAFMGSEGTLVYDLSRDQIRGARRSEPELQPMPIPQALRGGWQVESDFVAAIRGERPVTHTDFATGVRYMQFTEAVARSSRHQSPVTLPLREFSNPSL